LKRKDTTSQMGNSSSFSILRTNYRREAVVPLNPNTLGSTVEPPKPTKKDSTTTVQGKTKTQTNYNHDIKCFRCLEN
jgi:hypothetical protein